MRLAWAPALIVVLAAAAPVAAQAPALENAQARAHLERALELYKSKSYGAAAAEIEAAYGIEAKPELLYMWAQSKRLGGDCRAATDLYQRFLSTGPSAEEAARAQKNVQRCSQQLPPAGASPGPAADPRVGAPGTSAPSAPAPGGPPPAARPGEAVAAPSAGTSPGTPPAGPKPGALALAAAPARPDSPPPPAAVATAAAPPPAAAEPQRTPWDQNNLGHALVIGSIVSGLSASGLYFWARNEWEEASAARVYEDAAQHADAATLRRNLAYGAAGLAVALLVTSVVVYIKY